MHTAWTHNGHDNTTPGLHDHSYPAANMTRMEIGYSLRRLSLKMYEAAFHDSEVNFALIGDWPFA